MSLEPAVVSSALWGKRPEAASTVSADHKNRPGQAGVPSEAVGNRIYYKDVERGSTLVEILVTIPIAVAIMGILFGVILGGTNLVARNCVINVSHINALTPMERLTSELHRADQSATSPVLVTTQANGSFQLLGGTGTAAGLQFNLIYGGPYVVASACAQNSTSVAIGTGSSAPAIKAGMRLVIPQFQIDSVVASASTSGTTVNCTLTGPLVSASNPAILISATSAAASFILVPTTYYVVGSDLRRYDASYPAGSYVTVMRNILPTSGSSAVPFNIPTVGSPVMISLAAADPNYSKRGFKTDGTLFYNISVPLRGHYK